MVLDPAIEEFFSARKEAWLKKNLKADISDFEKKLKERECCELFELSNWLPNAAKRAGQISISTHPCTFSHPSAKKNKNGEASSIVAKNKGSRDGFLRTGNVTVEPDALGNAAALDVYKFLNLKMSDGQSLFEHIKQRSELASFLLKKGAKDSETLRADFLKMIKVDQSIISSSKIKQVYFPVDEDEYHLLSILTHSGHVFELKRRIDTLRFSEKVKEARECKTNDKYHPEGYRDIFDITTIGYGGTKPQNISVLNLQNGGKAHLLLSAPPALTTRDIRLPKDDFFTQVINPWQNKDIFEALHRIFIKNINNIDIREERDNLIQEYVDSMIEKMWQLRIFINSYQGQLPQSLKKEQRIWLYPEFEQYRLEQDDWLEQIVLQMTVSIIHSYKKILEKKMSKRVVFLADAELTAFEAIVKSNKELLR